MLGVGQTSNSALHVAEEYAGIPKKTSGTPPPQAGVRLPEGNVLMHTLDNSPSCSAGFEAAACFLRQAQLVCDACAGSCLIQVMRGMAVIECIVRLLRKQPEALLCSNPYCESCTATRQRIRNNSNHEFLDHDPIFRMS